LPITERDGPTGDRPAQAVLYYAANPQRRYGARRDALTSPWFPAPLSVPVEREGCGYPAWVFRRDRKVSVGANLATPFGYRETSSRYQRSLSRGVRAPKEGAR
jgi:hypothetical protein